MFDAMEFRIARLRKGWTVKRLAQAIGYTSVWLSLCETGKGRPSRRLLKAWTEALGLAWR